MEHISHSVDSKYDASRKRQDLMSDVADMLHSCFRGTTKSGYVFNKLCYVFNKRSKGKRKSMQARKIQII